MPIIEILEGGWPWILVWPIGFLWACLNLNTRWGIWAFSTQMVIAGSILPLKMQLPWYVHPIWLPFALICSPPVSWLIQKKERNNIVGKKLLNKVPYVLFYLGIFLFNFSLLVQLNIINFEEGYLSAIFPISFSWMIG